MEGFSCIEGCIECCLDDEFIPVTLADLYRQWVFDYKIGGVKKTFFQVFGERCDGWDFIYVKDQNELPVPRSKVPCFNIDFENQNCRVHGYAKYLACSITPELFFLPKFIAMIEKLGTLDDALNVFERVGCIKDKCLSEEARVLLIRRSVLHEQELVIGGEYLALNLDMQNPQEELTSKIKWMSGLDYEKFKDYVWPTVGPTQMIYMDLFGISSPDYTSLKTLIELLN